MRYVNQMPGEQTFTDHLGNERTVDGRNDIWPHRVMVFLKGWLGTPKLVYTITFWTVLDTNQNAIFGNLGYQFSRKFSVYAGLNGNPGIALAPGVAPLLARPRSRDGRRVLPAVLQLRRLGSGRTRARPLVQRDAGQQPTASSASSRASWTASFTTGASMWWMPTTKEFGPRGAYGDWEQHEKVATRFGVSTTRSPEQRFANSGGTAPTTPRSGWRTA